MSAKRKEIRISENEHSDSSKQQHIEKTLPTANKN